MSKSGAGAARVAVSLDEESRKQLEVLSRVFRINISSVVSMAVARWFHAEPLVKSTDTDEKDAEASQRR